MDEGKPVDLSKMPPPPDQSGKFADPIFVIMKMFSQTLTSLTVL